MSASFLELTMNQKMLRFFNLFLKLKKKVKSGGFSVRRIITLTHLPAAFLSVDYCAFQFSIQFDSFDSFCIILISSLLLFQLILKFFDMFLKLPDQTSSAAFQV